MKGKDHVDRVAQGVIERLDELALATKDERLRTLLLDASIVIDVYKSGGIDRLVARLKKENADTNETSNEARARLYINARGETVERFVGQRR